MRHKVVYIVYAVIFEIVQQMQFAICSSLIRSSVAALAQHTHTRGLIVAAAAAT